jgi:hypothetical protein
MASTVLDNSGRFNIGMDKTNDWKTECRSLVNGEIILIVNMLVPWVFDDTHQWRALLQTMQETIY